MPYKKYVRTELEIAEEYVKNSDGLRLTLRAICYDAKNLLEKKINKKNEQEIKDKIKNIARIELLLEQIRVI